VLAILFCRTSITIYNNQFIFPTNSSVAVHHRRKPTSLSTLAISTADEVSPCLSGVSRFSSGLCLPQVVEHAAAAAPHAMPAHGTSRSALPH
jgi:hypothetical protein